MDTRKKYIEMCYSREIQELSKRETGDYYYQIKDDGETCKGVFICWNGLKPNGGYHNWHDEWYFPDNCIWLIRQDQLQKMVDNPIDFATEMFYSLQEFGDPFHCYTKNIDDEKYWTSMESMEQLWLALIMYEKYNKKWKDNKWINVKEKK